MLKKKLKFFISFITIVTLLFFIHLKYQNHSLDNILNQNKISIYDNHNEIIYECVNNHESSCVNINDVSPIFLNFLIEMEDKDFYRHNGFNIYRITRILANNIINKRKDGASTITQQYIKNLYLSNKKSYTRKVNELYLSILSEMIYTKDEILEGYLNTIYFSNNLYGINDACKYYFNKSPNEINVNEMALLLVLIKAPGTYSPTNEYSKAMCRKDEYLKILFNKNLISLDVFNEYYRKDLIIKRCKIEHYPSSVMYFKDVILEEFGSLNIKQKFNEHYKIYTNYEKNVNDKIYDYVLKNNNGDISCVIIDKDGYYVSVIGGNNYYDYSYNVAINGDRDIGSVVKPLLYYGAIEDGFTPLTTFYCGKKTFNSNNKYFDVSNHNELYEDNPITLSQALATSDNIYAVKTHLYLGFEKLTNTLRNFNIASKPNITHALGNVSTSLKNITNTYLTLANLGSHKEPKGIKEVSSNDTVIYKRKIEPERLLNQSKTYILNSMMTLMFDDNISGKTRVTGHSINKSLKIKTAGKSGLTDYDSYMIGFNNDYCVGVWAGHNDNKLLTDPSIKTLPKKVYSLAFNNLEKRNDLKYTTPKNVVYKQVCPNINKSNYKRDVPFLK